MVMPHWAYNVHIFQSFWSTVPEKRLKADYNDNQLAYAIYDRVVQN